VIPADIRWSQLAKPYGHVHENGRSHPAFDDAGVAWLLTEGLDPAGNRIDEAMPLYSLSEADLTDLIAYVKRVETDWDPGIERDRLQVGTLLPLAGPSGELGRAMAQALYAYLEEVNHQGGLFGRRLDLLAIPMGASPEETLDNLRLALQREGVFALVGAYTVGLDEEILDLLRREQVPLVGPFTLDPGDETLNEAAFYLYPGFAEQARVLADQAVDQAGDGPTVVIAPAGAHGDRLTQAVRDQLHRRGGPEPVEIRYAAGKLEPDLVAETLAQDGGEALLFFGSQSELDGLLPALAAQEKAPSVYLLSSLLGHSLFDAPPVLDQRIFLAYPTLASDISEAGRAEYQELATRHALPDGHLQGQVAAFAAAKLLVEGLKRAGRELSRQALVSSLEGLYDYETGLTPALSYGPNRRVGARGAHVVAVDLVNRSYQPIGGWHEPR
jgi:ABC-type branched-subunit amino acid transport system substrate-binding protein